jgi:hypothetical protein
LILIKVHSYLSTFTMTFLPLTIDQEELKQ